MENNPSDETFEKDIIKKSDKSKIRETIEAVLIAIVIALFLRAFVVEAFKIPSSSMVPNLKIGDHIFVNKFVYGLRLPFTLKQIVAFNEPKRGDIIVFNYPEDTTKDYIKRLVAVPGDRVRIEDTSIYVNGEILGKEDFLKYNHRNVLYDVSDGEQYNLFRETNIDNVSYTIMYRKQRMWGLSEIECLYCKSLESGDFIVPKNKFFAMGDNRDNSADSRRWGFIPREYIKGRALFIWLSLNSDNTVLGFLPSVRWERFGKLIK